MSSQNAKKRRLGSRRVAPSQSEVPKADKYHLTETSSVAQDYAVEESTESLNVLSSQEDLKLETRNPPSAEVAFNRRKIGSNRRSKGKQLVDDLETEPYLNPGKELEEKSRGNETFETIQTPQAVELKQQEEFSQGSDHVSALAKDYSESTPDQNSEATKHSSEGVMEILTPKINNLQECNTCKNETKLEEIDKSDTQREEIKENMHPVAQQSSSDVPDEEPLTVYSVGEIQSTERDDTNLLRQDGMLQGNNLVNESHVKFEALEAVTLNITTDKNSPEKNIEVVCSVEQETFSSSKEKLTTNEDPCSLSEVREEWQSEDAMNKIHEVNIKPIEIQDMYQNDYSSEIQGIDVTENADICSGNPEDQTEMKDTHSSQMKVKNNNVFRIEQEDVNFNEKQYAHPTNDIHPECLEKENEDTQVYDYKQQVITDTALSQLVATEMSNAYKSQLMVQTVDDSVSNNYKLSEQHINERHLETLTEENEDSNVDMSNCSVQTLPSEVNTLLETHPVYDSIGKKRKMGSTRRNKGRQRDKEFKDEDAIGDETPVTIQMSATEDTRPEELLQVNECDVPLSVPHDSSMFTVNTPAYSPEVQNPTTTTSYPDISSSSLIHESEKRQDEQDFKVVSNKPLESGMEEVDESETALVEEVKDANHSEETVRKMHEDEVEPTQIQEVLRNDFSSENVIDDATENSSMTSGNLSQTENSNTYQFQVMGQNPDESVTKVEASTLDDKQAEHYFVTQENEEDAAVNSENGGVSLQSVTSLATTSFESQLQDDTVSTDKQTRSATESRGHRRKMGSTHRNKGRQHDKEFKGEDAIGDETLETTEMSATETTRPEELLQVNECDVPLSVPHDSSMFTVSTPAYSPEVQNPTTTSYPEISSSSLIPQSEKHQDEQDFKVVSNKPLESGMEEVDESETALVEEVKDANHSEETVRKMHEDEVEPTQIQEVLRNDFSSENVIDDATENSSMTSGNLSQTENSNTYQFQVMGQNPDESVTKVEASTLDDKQAEHYFVTQENEEDAAVNSKNGGVSLQSVTSLAITSFESQLQDNTVSTDKQTRAATESRGHRRKMGSTCRNKGRQHDKEFKGEDAIGDETLETTEMSATETTRPEELLQVNECDVPLSVSHDSSMFTVSTPAYSPEVQNPTTTSYPEISSSTLIPQSEKRQEEQDFKVVSNKPLESGMEEVDESETALVEEVKDANHSEETVRKMHEDEVEPTQIQEVLRNDFSSENVIDDATENSSMTSGNLSQTENSNTYQFQVMGQNPDESVTKVEVSTLDDKQAEHYFVTQENEEDAAVNSKNGGVSLQSVTSLAITSFESQLQDDTVSTDKQTRSATESRGHRRKMGSTRRNKGRQHDKEFKGEDAIGDETLETTEMSATETTRPEELLQGNECDVPLFVSHDSSMFTVSTPAYSPEVQNPTTTTSYPEISSSTLIPQSEKHQDEQDFKVVSNKPLESGMEEVDESETALVEEVKDANHSEETVRKMHEDEVEPTQIQEVLRNDFSSENVIDDATENSSMTSGNLSQTENSNTYQFQVMGHNPDESVTKVEVSTLEDQQAGHYFVTQENEEDFAVDSKNGGVSLQSVTSLATTSFESQLQDDTVSTDKQTRAATESRGHRRKMGSTCRNKGRQHDKEFKGEDAIGDETLETTEMSATETTRPEELLQVNECDVPLSVPHDSSMFTVSTPAYSPEVQNPTTTTSYPEISSSTLIPQSEKHQDEQDFKVVSNKPLESGMEEVDESETALVEEVKDANHSEETVRKMHEDEVEPTQIQEVLRNDFSSENVIDDATENSSMTSGNLSQTENSNTYQVQVMVQSIAESVTKVEVSTADDKQAGHNFVSQANKETDASDSKAAGVSLQSPHSISNPSFENHFQENIVSTSEQFHNVFDRGSRRKMGSSRRNIGRNRDKEFKDEDTVGDEIPETAETSATVAKRPEELLQENKRDLSLSVPYSENSLENQNVGDSKVINDKPVEAGMEEVEKDPHTKLLAQDGNLPSNILLSGTECTISVEITEKTSPRESIEVECSVAQETFLASQDVLTANMEQHERCNPTDKLHQTDYSSSTESHQMALSETHISSDFQHQDNSQNITEIQTGLSRTGNRKKMGSSRRNKGRQCVKDPDAYQEPIDDVLEKPTSNDNLRTVKMSPATDITKEEEAKDLISIEKEMHINLIAKEGKNTEKLLEEDAFFSQNNKKDSNTDGLLKSNKDVNEENKVVQEPMNLDQLTGCDTITKHLMQSPQASVCEVPSDMQHISYHGGIESSSSLKVLDKEEAFEAMEASNGQQEQTQSGNRNHLQINPKQKKRKIGSTRRSQLNRKKEEETDNTDETKESDFHTEADVRNIAKMDVGELPLTTDVPQNETAQPLFSAVHKQQEADEAFSEPSSTEINVIPVAEDFKAPLPEQSSSLREETISLVTYVNTADVREVIVEPPQLDDFTNTETQMITVVAGRCRRSINQLLSPNTEAATDTGIAEESLVSSSVARQNTYSDEERPESIKVVQDQDANEKNPNDLNEGAHNKTQEMRSESPILNLSNRRRKIGSTRRNLGSRNKEELHQKQEVDNEAKETGTDVGETESVPRIKEEALQLHTDRKDIDGEQGKQKLFETVELSPPGQSPFKPLPEQTVEERPVSQDQLAETEHHTANYLLSTSFKDDVVSESASGGRRRKLGSNRRSRGHQHTEDETGQSTIIDDQSGTDAKISEVGKSDKKPSSELSKSEEHSKTVSEKTSAQPCNAGIFLGKENQTLSLVNNPGVVDPKSKRYNVVMIGDSSVGKTSFMKRAQSGKFSLDIPASIGLDSLMWPVVVDGKPMILQLWDTAGQERFHSITKQVFHKAQAFLLMYDITSTNSFSAVSYWANCIQESAAENVTVLLLGNKSDCSERRVKTHQGEILAKEYDFEFMECSAATGENVIQSLEVVARKLSQRIDSREEATVLHKEPEQKKSSRCC